MNIFLSSERERERKASQLKKKIIYRKNLDRRKPKKTTLKKCALSFILYL